MSEEIVLTPELSRDLIARGSKNQKVVAKFSLYPHDGFVKAHPVTHCDVTLVVDTSGSMNEPFAAGASLSKRQGVAQAIEAMLPTLDAADTLSLVCYDSAAYVELDHVPGAERERIRAAIQGIFRHNGATNFEKAFAMAKATAAKGRHASRKVVFLTDGNATQGKVTNARQHNRELADLGVTVDCLGVGADFNFNEMQAYSAVSNGRTELLASPAEAGNLFPQLLQGAQKTLINHCVLRLALAAGCRDTEIYQLTPEVRYFSDLQPGSDGAISYRVNLQSMMHTHSYAYLIQTKLDLPAAKDVSFHPFLRVRLDYDVPVKSLKGQVLENTVGISLADEPGREICDTLIDSDYIEATLEKLDQQVNQAAGKSDWKQAATLLHDMKRKAEKLGDADKARDYQRRLDALRTNGRLTQEDLNWIGRASSRSTRLRCGQREASNQDLY